MGCDSRRTAWGGSRSNFNPRTPVGCDSRNRRLKQDKRFQSTHPSGVRRRFHLLPKPRGNFNPRTPVGCDQSWKAETRKGYRFQSTHPSGVRQDLIVTNGSQGQFQSTHPSGVRLAQRRERVFLVDFNPRTPVGCDWPKDASVCSLSISIHAPQWGATTAPGVPRPATADFNPRTPVGCDARLFPVDVYCNLFQSTHPSGVRPIPVGYRPVDKSFQSTHPSGVRLLYCNAYGAGLRISIHAPQWGATQQGLKEPPDHQNFNPRTPVGCDRTRWPRR